MAKEVVLAKVTTAEPGVLRCWGARAGDLVFQAMSMGNGDSVTGIFAPVIPGSDVIVQAKIGPGIECLILLHRNFPDG